MTSQALPKMFMASSKQDGALLVELSRQLVSVVEPIPWTDDKGKMGRNLMDWAQGTVDKCRFGLFLLTPDGRWGGQVNGNVLLELGLFVSRHGLEQAFIVTTEQTPVPPDLAGILSARFDPELAKTDPANALAPPVRQILQELPQRRTLADDILGPWLEIKEAEKKEGRLSLVYFYFERGELKLKGRSFSDDCLQRIEWPRDLNYCWIPDGRDEVYHTFDAEYERGQHKALGVTRFRFEKDRQNGDGYFVVHGAGDIKQGQIGFKLQRITDALLASYGLPPDFDFDNRAACETFIRVVMKTSLTKRKRQT